MMVNPISLIVKFILMLNLNFSRPQMNHIVHMMHGIILCEGRKNISQIHNKTTQYRDLSCITRFLKESPWDEGDLQARHKQLLMDMILKSRQSKGDARSVVFLIVDDTKCIKDPSTKQIEGLDFHFSHEDGKSTWSHSLVTAHVVNEGYSFAWDFRPYFREEYCKTNGIKFKSKNDLAIEMIQEYPFSHEEIVYVHSLDHVTILSYYQVRWNIETGYRYFKETLGFDQYQLQSFKAIRRFWAIQFLTYNFLELQRKEWSNERLTKTLGDVVRRIRVDALGQIVLYVYQQAQVQKPIIDILKALKLTA